MLTRPGRLVWVLSSAVLIASAAAPVPARAAVSAVGPDAVVERYARALGDANGRLSLVVRHALAERLLLLARYYALDPGLLAALVSVESSWRPGAVSPVGALGFGQLMPATAASLDVVALEPYENLDGTARYLRRLLNRYPGADKLTRVRLALASYNAGPAAVARYNGVPPYRETQAYVRNVVERWQRFGAIVAGPTMLAASTMFEQPAATIPPAAPLAARPRVVAHHHKAAAHPHKPLRVAAAKRHPHHPRHMLVAVLPIALPTPPPAPVRWEPSHSLFARMLGFRHRTTAPDPATAMRAELTISPPAASAAAAGDRF
jgi:hypothetical protein